MRTEYAIHPCSPENVPALSGLWERTFGDGPELIGEFFRLLPRMGGGVAAVLDGRVVGGAYAVTGFELAVPGAAPRRLGYIYAVAVEESCRGRGIGRGLTLAAAELAKKMGAEDVCTLPAEPGLYKWYEDILGIRAALARHRKRIESAPGCAWRQIGAEEYGARREALLSGAPHVALSAACLEFQRALCRAYGGGFFACGGGIAAAYKEGERLIVRELLCSRSGVEGPAASLASGLGVREAELCLPVIPGAGEDYMSAPPGVLPPGCIWGLSFD